MSRKGSEKEYKITCNVTDKSTGITKNINDMSESERRRAAVIMGMRALKSLYGQDCVIELTNPKAKELYGIQSI